MTRFWITIEQGVDFVLECLEHMVGGELFVPKLPSMNIMDLANSIAPDGEIKVVGIRPGEKLHEVMISKDEAIRTLEFKDYYMIQPTFKFFERRYKNNHGVPVPEDFEYNSGTNKWFLTIQEMGEIIKDIK